jgi:hypothetical protein
MRLFPVLLTSALLLASAPGFAQNVAAKAPRPYCPPGEPDSLQISWNQPCDNGNWLLDTQTGCRMWDWHPEPEDKVTWKGGCQGGLPDGSGEAQWYEHGRPIDRFVGTYRMGKREGEGHYQWNEEVRFDGTYANDLPDGHGVLKIAGDTFAGDWKGGCFTGKDGRVVAIGVPRTTCRPASLSKPKDKVAAAG